MKNITSTHATKIIINTFLILIPILFSFNVYTSSNGLHPHTTAFSELSNAVGLNVESSQADSLIPPDQKNWLSIARFDSLSNTEMQLADWNMQVPAGYYYNGYIQPSDIGDINGDGYDDFIVNMYKVGIPGQEALFIYNGSSTGIDDYPNAIQILNDTTIYGSMEILAIEGIGDMNGDGYDDLIISCYYRNRGIIREDPLLFYGSASGLSATPVKIQGVNYEFAKPEKIGDVNGDGFDDIVFIYDYPYMTGRLYYGSADGPVNGQSWPSDLYMEDSESWVDIFPGDFNNDGFGDIAVSGGELFIFYGSASGLPDTHQQKVNLLGGSYSTMETFIISGDYNGDHYSDLILIAHLRDLSPGSYDTRRVLFLLPGSSNYLDTTNYLIIKDWNADYYNSTQLSDLGDINNDNFSDFSLGSTIYFGGVDIENFNSTIEFNSMVFQSSGVPGIHSSHLGVFSIGDLNNDGSTDFIRTYPSTGIYYAPRYEPFQISCPDTIIHCYTGPDQHYSIPLIDLSNSHFSSVGYSIYDIHSPSNPKRTGHGLDASGTFNADSKIYYIAQGYNNVMLACTTAFKFNYVPVTNVSIKANSSHPKGDPNTFYIGYGATEFRIEALPAGGGGPYTYLWSNGSTEKNPRISETVPGEYPYWVKMTNANGCTSSDSSIIKVENALCSSPLVDAVMSQYPMILQNPVLANLIKSNSKIAVCKDGQTMCFTKAVVDIRITRAGYTIGACTPGVIPAEAFMTDEMEEILRGELKVIVAPNPSSHSFQLSVVSIYNAPVMIQIMDLAGRQVEVLNNVSANQTITFGHKLRSGTYIAEVISGKERKVVKLVKMN